MKLVLIVDDEEELADMVAMLVEDVGLHSLVATNGREAIELLHHSKTLPALIITDIMMPFMNGLELIAYLRTSSHYHHIPIIMMSAASSAVQEVQADVFLNKPFDMDELINWIERLIG